MTDERDILKKVIYELKNEITSLTLKIEKYQATIEKRNATVILLGTHPIYSLFFGLPRDLDSNILSSFSSIFSIKLSQPKGRPLLI